MRENQSLYTKEPDGSIMHWYLWDWVGNRFAVSASKGKKRLSDYRRYYEADDLGKKIFLSRKKAQESSEQHKM
ncbi:MAG: hypothetical protein PHI27_06410 [Eubacteriales bacterium]|nr:hypothetical protein [Eubacteriales bacterium]MDD3881867.1 hypothetical protein [Eubacteriales bacterium]MDD4512888.1 hypothetical protein [Eubacteriales bacterium]